MRRYRNCPCSLSLPFPDRLPGHALMFPTRHTQCCHHGFYIKIGSLVNLVDGPCFTAGFFVSAVPEREQRSDRINSQKKISMLFVHCSVSRMCTTASELDDNYS